MEKSGENNKRPWTLIREMRVGSLMLNGPFYYAINQQHKNQHYMIMAVQQMMMMKMLIQYCTGQLLEFTEELLTNLESGQQTDVLNMDFANVNHSLFIHKLQQYGIQGSPLSLLT